jgi:hypothetical protein
MEKNEKAEQQVEDLEMQENDAEDVKGGSLNFTRQAAPTDQIPTDQKSLNFTKGYQTGG